MLIRKPKLFYEVRVTQFKNGIKNEDRRFFKKKKIAYTLFLDTEKIILTKYKDYQKIEIDENNYSEIEDDKQYYLIQKVTYSSIRTKNILDDSMIVEIFECILV